MVYHQHLRAKNDEYSAKVKDRLEIPEGLQVSQKTADAVAKPLPPYLASIPEVNLELFPRFMHQMFVVPGSNSKPAFAEVRALHAYYACLQIYMTRITCCDVKEDLIINTLHIFSEYSPVFEAPKQLYFCYGSSDARLLRFTAALNMEISLKT